MAALEGQIWLAQGGSDKLFINKLSLLRAIADEGSISAAAKKLGISYKTAWDWLERLNNLSSKALVLRSSGGHKGGGSQLTEYGRKLIKGYDELKKQHEEFIQSLNKQLESLDDISNFVKHSSLKSSARNQYLGSVVDIVPGAVNTELSVELSPSLRIVAIVTEHSRAEMALSPGDEVIAMIKASSVTLATGTITGLSARNQFSGVITGLDRGPVNTDVTMDLGTDKTLSAIITSQSLDSLMLEQGQVISAFFKASSVILLKP